MSYAKILLCIGAYNAPVGRPPDIGRELSIGRTANRLDGREMKRKHAGVTLVQFLYLHFNLKAVYCKLENIAIASLGVIRVNCSPSNYIPR